MSELTLPEETVVGLRPCGGGAPVQVWLNHYWSYSALEYDFKMRRGRADSPGNKARAQSTNLPSHQSIRGRADSPGARGGRAYDCTHRGWGVRVRE